MNRRTFLRIGSATALAIPFLGSVAFGDETDDGQNPGAVLARAMRKALRELARQQGRLV